MPTLGQQIVARAAAWAAQNRLILRKAARPTPEETLGETAAQKIADDMLDIAAVRGCCEEDDLLARGWTPDALRRHGQAARDIANAASVRAL